ncbi:DUF4157 domain-containing protein [Pseudomonadota bacterium]
MDYRKDIASRKTANKSVAASLTRKGNQTAQFVDNRDCASVQRKLIDSLNSTNESAPAQRVEDEELMQGKFETAQRVEDEELMQGKFETAQRVEDEELMQGKFETAQRAGAEEDELLQGKFDTAQRQGDEEELLQGKFETAQRMGAEEGSLQGKLNPLQRQAEEELLQGKLETTQRAGMEDKTHVQGKFANGNTPVQRQENPSASNNQTGLPDTLKSGIESLSGLDVSDVRVHRNSSKPAQLNAHAYAQGNDIHLGSGQEQHLPHEAWHVVQQRQGKVKPTMQMAGGVPVNDDAGLETEADVMGAKALGAGNTLDTSQLKKEYSSSGFSVQAKWIDDDVRKLDGGNELGGVYDLKVAGAPKGTKLKYKYKEHSYQFDDDEAGTKHEAMIIMQETLADVGEEAPHSEMANNVSKATAKNKGKAEWPDAGAVGSYYPQDEDSYWPFAVDIKLDYKHKSNRNRTPGEVGISAFFAPGKYGYITEVYGGGDGYDIDINEPPERLQLQVPDLHGGDTYSSEHSVDGVRDLTQDGIHMEDGDGADAWTKVVAEGARWESVQALTEKSLLTNTSKFYALVDDGGRAFQQDDEENPPYIQFQDLWTQWRHWKNQWNITSEQLAEALNDGLHGSNDNVELETLAGDTHNLGVG